MTGIIFDIQRFCVHDGPGIRTSVFMKGCPLRCKWCHNPEGLDKKIQVQFIKSECINCGKCKGQRKPSAAAQCPSHALKICGNKISSENLLTELLKDKIFYKDKGGVTFTGGECLSQAPFVIEVLDLLKKEGINTAIDTCGYVKKEDLIMSSDYCDLYLYDIKCIDSALHKKFTGVDNTLILDNLKELSKKKKKIWIRTPVIPDFNDNEKEMESIASFISSIPSIEKITLMPYHTLGKSKYETLGLIPPYNTDKIITKDILDNFKKIFVKYHIEVD